jgi:transcriptional regulator with XRE-family HTH domain
MASLTGAPESGPTAHPDIERTMSALGAKVAAERAARGWSLAQLAQRAGMSAAAVHKIEKNGMTPTIASLMKIASALGRSVSYFVDEPANTDVMVIRGDERAQVYTSKEGLELRNLSGRYGPFLIAGAEAYVAPHADSGPTPMNHPGEELVIVTQGAMVFEVDGERHELAAGDSIHFRTSLPHSWSNAGAEPARAVWLVVRSS